MFLRIFSIFFTTLLLAFSHAPAVKAQSSENVMVVFDGSGSMWGQIEGKAKIEIARDAIGEMVGSWNTDTSIGLIAYGHRKKGDCTDIETILSVGPLNKAAFISAIKAISPKGKTPISAAVRKAAADLKFTEEKATVILISDGLETCNANPCALATELETAGVDFTTHVIGFDIRKADAPQLACLATNTGGKFISASNATELNKAITETVKTVQIVAEVKAEPEPEPVPAGPQGIKLIPVVCETCTEVLQDNVFWYLYEAKKDIEGNRRELDRSGTASALFETAEGTYYIYGVYGKAGKGIEVTVEPGVLTTLNVNFNAGNLRVVSAPTAGAEILNDNTFYWVYENKKDLNGDRREIDRSGAAKSLFRLPAGEYYVVARHGKSYVSQVLTVLPNELTDFTFDMNVGYLRVNSIPTSGGEILQDGLFYWIYEDKKDLEGNRKEIDRSGSALSLFRLPAGKYYVVSKHGNAYASATLEVDANSLSEHTFDMNVGYIRINATMAQGMAPIDNGMFYWVYENKKDLNGNRKEIDRSGSANDLFKLTAGEYYVVARHGKAYANKEISIIAGTLEEDTFAMNSATINVTPTVANGGALAGDVFWWVYGAKQDLQGNRKEIDHSGAIKDTFILPAGDYIFAVRNAGQIHNTEITLKPGEVRQQTIEIQ